MFSEKEKSSFKYWYAHRCAYNMVALCCNAWRVKYLFHDFEKPWLRLFMKYEKVRNFHRKHANHHPEWLENKIIHHSDYNKYLNKFDYEGAIIDWECSRFTKEDAQLNAHDEYNRLISYDYFSERFPNIARNCYNEFSIRLMKAIKKLRLENK